jgi:hypothetical protein
MNLAGFKVFYFWGSYGFERFDRLPRGRCCMVR